MPVKQTFVSQLQKDNAHQSLRFQPKAGVMVEGSMCPLVGKVGSEVLPR